MTTPSSVGSRLLMIRIVHIGLLVTLVSLAALPVDARGGGGHGGGGHCAGAHGGGRGGATHGGPGHGSIGHFVGRGRAAFGNGGYFGSDTSDFGSSFLDRIDATPQPSASDHLDGSGADKRWSSRPSTAEEEAQYRYDHRGGGD